jgi:hypothetical protein
MSPVPLLIDQSAPRFRSALDFASDRGANATWGVG